MSKFGEYFSLFKELLPVITAAGTVISAAGLVPRIGPGRAAWIAVRSRFALKPVPESIRSAEIELLRKTLADKDFGQSYVVVTGEKGVGKTCLIDTVTSKTPGVIKVKAQPSENAKSIIRNALQQLTRIRFDFIPPFDSAIRVIFWYRLFTLGRSPIVVINAAERKVGEEHAGLAGAVRTLVDDYKLCVVVDGSPNSVDETLLKTTRENVFDIKPMSKETIWEIGQLQELFKYIKEAGLDDAVYAVLGGIPSRYEQLWKGSKILLRAGTPPRDIIANHLCNQIAAAVKIVQDSRQNTKNMDEIIELFDKDKKCIPSEALVVKKLQRPNPDKVFREVLEQPNPDKVPDKVEPDRPFVLIPASNAIGIVLQHHLTARPSWNRLQDLLRPQMCK